MLRVLIFVVSLGARALRAMCRRRADLVIENLALRQQVTALKKERLSFIIINPPEREAIRLDEGRPKTRSTHLGRFRDRTANGFIRWTRKPQELRSRTLWPPKTALSCLPPFVAMVQPAHSP